MIRTRTQLPPIPAILAALLALFLALTAEAQVVGVTISGTLTDPSGAAVPNAQVLVHNDETGSERRLLTGPDGRYAAPSVPVGTYTVSAQAAGFAAARSTGIPLSVGQAQSINLTLALDGATQSITVQDAPSVVNLSTQQTSGLVDSRQIKELPLNGRSYDALITLNPGTANYTTQRSGSIGTSNSSVGNMFAVSGRRPQDNLYLLNGVEYTGASLINVTPGGTSGQLLGVEAVREFNVIADTYSAAYGKRQGAQVSIVTASGTNHVHGSAYEFLRNSFFDARNYFDPARIPEFQRNNFGASLGGPIHRDKLFLFANYEGYRQNLGLSDVTFVPDTTSRAAAVASVKPLLNLWPTPNGPELLLNGQPTGIAEAFSSPTQHIREDFGTARFDANLTPNDLLFAVFTLDDSTANTPTQDPLSLVNESLREQVSSLQEQHVFSPRLLNTGRLGFSRASFFFLGSVPPDVQAVTPTFVPGKPTGAIVIAGSTASNGASQITTAGANVGANNATTRNLFTFDDHIFYSRGKHQIEAGGWLQLLESNDNLAQDQYGQASFADLPHFLAGSIKTFTIVPSITELGWRSTFSAAYLEDTIKLRPNFELRAGLRTESTAGWNASHGRAPIYGSTNGVLNTTPSTGSSALTTNRAKFLPEPRIGLSYDPFATGRTVLRASFGLHQALLDTLDYRLDQSAPFNTILSYASTTVANPTFSTPTISPSTIQPDISTPQVLSWTLRLEQQIAPQTSITFAYVGSHGTHQILSDDLNEPASVLCPAAACPANLSTGTIFYPTTVKPNPALANTTSWVSQGSSSYNALQVDLRRALSNGLQLRANYTYARNLDDGSAWNTSVSANTPAFVEYPNNPGLDWGPAATDVRNLAALNATYDLPFGRTANQSRRFLAASNATVNRAISGWTLSAIATLQSGFPFSPQLGYNPTGSGDSRNPVRPNRNPAFTGQLYTRGSTAQRVAQYFSPAAFSAPAYGTVGNLSRDSLTGPGYDDLDLSLAKNTQLTEGVRVQFRAEFFNVMNQTNLSTPSETVFASGPTQSATVQGQTTAAQTAAATLSPTAGVITSAATTRQIQLGLKLLF